MTYRLKVLYYPNNEIRTILRRETSSRFDGDDSSKGALCGGDGTEPDPVLPALDITSKLSVAKLPGFGGVPRATKFGNNGRRTISRCAGAIERQGIPTRELVFLTGTIPGSTEEAFDAVAMYSSWTVKATKTWLSDMGVNSNYSLYVWEFQKRGALHLHYCVHVPDAAMRRMVLRGWKGRWTACIDYISKESGVDCWERGKGFTWATNKSVIQADAQLVTKSVGSYLSKYLSKFQGRIRRRKRSSAPWLCPVRWWGCSRPLLALMRSMSLEFEREAIPDRERGSLLDAVYAIVNWSENRVYSYRDKAGSTDVLLTYSPENCDSIYNYLKRDFYSWPAYRVKTSLQ
jgi:hypothetical protein